MGSWQIDEIKMTSQWIRVSYKLTTGALIGRWGQLDTETHRKKTEAGIEVI